MGPSLRGKGRNLSFLLEGAPRSSCPSSAALQVAAEVLCSLDTSICFKDEQIVASKKFLRGFFRRKGAKAAPTECYHACTWHGGAEQGAGMGRREAVCCLASSNEQGNCRFAAAVSRVMPSLHTIQAVPHRVHLTAGSISKLKTLTKIRQGFVFSSNLTLQSPCWSISQVARATRPCTCIILGK